MCELERERPRRKRAGERELCAHLWLDRGELTGPVANPIILSSDQSNTTAFRLFNGRVNFKLQCTL